MTSIPLAHLHARADPSELFTHRFVSLKMTHMPTDNFDSLRTVGYTKVSVTLIYIQTVFCYTYRRHIEICYLKSHHFFFHSKPWSLDRMFHPADWLCRWYNRDVTTIYVYRYVYVELVCLWIGENQVRRRLVSFEASVESVVLIDSECSRRRNDNGRRRVHVERSQSEHRIYPQQCACFMHGTHVRQLGELVLTRDAQDRFYSSSRPDFHNEDNCLRGRHLLPVATKIQFGCINSFSPNKPATNSKLPSNYQKLNYD